jgi:hypothetical protein
MGLEKKNGAAVSVKYLKTLRAEQKDWKMCLCRGLGSLRLRTVVKHGTKRYCLGWALEATLRLRMEQSSLV